MNTSIFDFITSSGIAGNFIMGVLFLLSIIATYLFVERYLVLSSVKRQTRKFVRKMEKLAAENRTDESKKLLSKNTSIASDIMRKALLILDKKEISISESNLVIDNIANNEVAKLEKGFSWLASIAGGAPMIGFLGTVIGMVQAFYEMSSIEGGNFDTSSLSQGIYTAMFTTVGGLSVGIIAYFSYNILVSKLSKIATELEEIKIGYIQLKNQ